MHRHVNYFDNDDENSLSWVAKLAVFSDIASEWPMAAILEGGTKTFNVMDVYFLFSCTGSLSMVITCVLIFRAKYKTIHQT